MSKYKLFVLSIIFVLFAAGLVFFNAKLKSDNTVLKDLPAALFPDVNDLTEIKISRPRYGNKVVLSVIDNYWRISEPLVDIINQSAHKLLLNELAQLRFFSVPANLTTQSLSDLGLASPDFVIESETTNSSVSTLLIGSQAVQSDLYIASYDGQLCMVPSSLISLISRPMESWRDSRLLSLRKKALTVSWEAVDENLSFVANLTSGRWRFSAPFDGLLSESGSAALNALVGTQLVSIGAPLPATGQFSVKLGELSVSDGLDTARLEVYKNAVVSNRRNYVMHISSKRLLVLGKTPLQLRSKRILDFNPQHLASLQINLKDKEHVITKSATNWVDRKSDAVYLDSQISSLIETLRLTEYGAETKPRPQRTPDGLIALSISRLPQIDKCPQFLWWVDDAGRNWICDKNSQTVYSSENNFELGVRSIVATED